MSAGNIEKIAEEIHLPRPIVAAFAHLDPLALGCACAIVFGLWAFSATAILLLRGGEVVGPNLRLLSEYFLGYRVSWAGSLIGFAYAALCGFVFGYAFGTLRNAITHFSLEVLHKKARDDAFNDLP
jgi:hypothetical protein